MKWEHFFPNLLIEFVRLCTDMNTDKVVEEHFENAKIEDYQRAEFEKLGFSPSKKMAMEKLSLSEKKNKPNAKFILARIDNWKSLLGPTEFDKFFNGFKMLAENQKDLPE